MINKNCETRGAFVQPVTLRPTLTLQHRPPERDEGHPATGRRARLEVAGVERAPGGEQEGPVRRGQSPDLRERRQPIRRNITPNWQATRSNSASPNGTSSRPRLPDRAGVPAAARGRPARRSGRSPSPRPARGRRPGHEPGPRSRRRARAPGAGRGAPRAGSTAKGWNTAGTSHRSYASGIEPTHSASSAILGTYSVVSAAT
jgi:hypothetical protein